MIERSIRHSKIYTTSKPQSNIFVFMKKTESHFISFRLFYFLALALTLSFFCRSIYPLSHPHKYRFGRKIKLKRECYVSFVL